MFGEEMLVFWTLTGMGLFFFLVLAGAGLNVYLRGKGTMYARIREMIITEEKSELS